MRRPFIAAVALFALLGTGGCGFFQRGLFTTKAKREAVDTLQKLTGHKTLSPWRQPNVAERGLPVEELLGHTVSADSTSGVSIGPAMWNGRLVGLSDADQSIDLELTGKTFLEFKPTLERLFGLAFSANKSYLVKLQVRWHAIRLDDPQPRLEFLGDEELYRRPYIQSVAYASYVKIETFLEREVKGKILVEPLPLVSISTGAGARQTEGHTTEATNVIFGYLPQTGTDWYERRVAKYPQVKLKISTPSDEQVIKSPKVRVRVSVEDYTALGPSQGDLQIYAWVQRIGGNQGYLSPIGAPVDVGNGVFELVTNLGELDEGNGERYSIVVFALFYKLQNVESRTALQVTSFTRPARDNGRVSVVVARKDEVN